jgi:hypothetical protein
MATLPACMMPDGAEPCEAFRELQTEVERLRMDKDVQRSQDRNTAYEVEIERLLELNVFLIDVSHTLLNLIKLQQGGTPNDPTAKKD